jgi:hypothetical protein
MYRRLTSFVASYRLSYAVFTKPGCQNRTYGTFEMSGGCD